MVSRLTIIPRWFILLTGLKRCKSYHLLLCGLFYEAICFSFAWCYLFLCFSVLWALGLPRWGKRELILVFVVRLFDLRLFGFLCFLFLPLDVWQGMRLVIAACPGHFSFLFCVVQQVDKTQILLARLTRVFAVKELDKTSSLCAAQFLLNTKHLKKRDSLLV